MSGVCAVNSSTNRIAPKRHKQCLEEHRQVPHGYKYARTDIGANYLSLPDNPNCGSQECGRATKIPHLCGILTNMRFVPVFCFFAAAALFASDAYPPPRFTDPERVRKLESAFPEVDQIFRHYASERKIPGMVWGVVIDGRLAHVESVGVRDRSSNAPIDAGTEFRIASMTKSFTTLAILKLRDEGKLSLEDRVSKWLPEFARMELPTRDTRASPDPATPQPQQRAPRRIILGAISNSAPATPI